MTCGGLSAEGKWLAGNPEYLLPVPVLVAKFLGKFLAYLRKGFEAHTATGKVTPSAQVLLPPPARACSNG